MERIAATSLELKVPDRPWGWEGALMSSAVPLAWLEYVLEPAILR